MILGYYSGFMIDLQWFKGFSKLLVVFSPYIYNYGEQNIKLQTLKLIHVSQLSIKSKYYPILSELHPI